MYITYTKDGEEAGVTTILATGANDAFHAILEFHWIRWKFNPYSKQFKLTW